MFQLLLILTLLGVGFNTSVFIELFSEIPMYQLLLSFLVPVKPRRLTKKEKEDFTLSLKLKEILIGLLLGDLYARKQKLGINSSLTFLQGVIHDNYLLHLFDLFQDYCPQGPRIVSPKPDKRTGKVYKSIYFNTYSLPCLNEFYNLFYLNGVKTVPLNIGDLLTPLGLCYWICDDGSFKNNGVILHTQSFSNEKVNLLVRTLNDKFNLKCTIYQDRGKDVIRISSKSLPELQNLLKDLLPPMMKYKIGLK